MGKLRIIIESMLELSYLSGVKSEDRINSWLLLAMHFFSTLLIEILACSCYFQSLWSCVTHIGLNISLTLVQRDDVEKHIILAIKCKG